MIVEAKCRVQRPALECLRWVKGRRGRQADGTAGLPPAPEIAGAFRHLRFVPKPALMQGYERSLPVGLPAKHAQLSTAQPMRLSTLRAFDPSHPNLRTSFPGPRAFVLA